MARIASHLNIQLGTELFAQIHHKKCQQKPKQHVEPDLRNLPYETAWSEDVAHDVCSDQEPQDIDDDVYSQEDKGALGALSVLISVRGRLDARYDLTVCDARTETGQKTAGDIVEAIANARAERPAHEW